MREFDAKVQAAFEQSPVPGLACAAVTAEGVAWSAGFGWADVEKEVPMTADTIMNIASVSKVVTATAVMKLWEEQSFDLDADVNDLLSFRVRNPCYPDIPITIRQLLTHRSSIKDGPSYDASYVCGVAPDSPSEWLFSVLHPDGQQFDAAGNFHEWPPGTVDPPEEPRPYSNVGFGLLALVAETIAGQPFEELSREKLFSPLGMTDSTWRLEDVPPGRHAALYSTILNPESDERVEFVPEQAEVAVAVAPGTLFRHCLYDLPIKTDGLLRTSANELGMLLSLYTCGGAANGKRILRVETLDTMLSNEHFGRALCWQGGPREDGSCLWYHGGSDPGVGTALTYDPNRQIGVVLLANYGNGDPVLNEVHREIRRAFR